MSGSDPILDLRGMLFLQERLIEAQSALPADDPGLTIPEENRVLGVVTEIGLEQLTIIVAGYINGDARLLNTLGGGLLGNLYEYPQVARSARILVDTAQNLFDYSSVDTNSRPLPVANMVRFTLLTLHERRVVEIPGPEVITPNHPFHPLFQATTLLSDELHNIQEQMDKANPPKP